MRQDTDPLPPSFRESLGSDNPLVDYFLSTLFLASQDALEVMLVSESVSESLTLRTELTDVTLVSEDTC